MTLAGATQSLRRQAQRGSVERYGSRQINDKIELRWLLDRNVGWFRSAQDFVDKLSGAPVEVAEVCSIGHQPCRLDVVTSDKHGREACRQRQSVDTDSIRAREWVITDIKGFYAAF